MTRSAKSCGGTALLTGLFEVGYAEQTEKKDCITGNGKEGIFVKIKTLNYVIINPNQYIILINGILTLNSSVLLSSEGYISQYNP